jgi:hypothetical protein
MTTCRSDIVSLFVWLQERAAEPDVNADVLLTAALAEVRSLRDNFGG